MDQHALSYAGPKLWNNIKIDVKLVKSRNIFKHKIIEEHYIMETRHICPNLVSLPYL